MNTNWSKILLFTLLGFALGWLVCCYTCNRCGGGDCHGGGCGKEMSCHGGMSQCDHGGKCCSGNDSHCDKARCDHKMGGACCKDGHGMGHGEGHGKGHDDESVRMIVADLEKAGFQGDTTIAIENGTVQVTRSGDSTTVKVEVREEEVKHEHAH